MFITLKCASGQGDTEMEQVASQGASPGDHNPLRLGRRPACLSCQTKKLRCTGRIGNCDRCRVRSIACVFPSSQGRNNNSQNNRWSLQGQSQQRNGGEQPVVAGEYPLQPSNLATSPSPQEAGPSAAAPFHNNNPHEGHLFDLNFQHEMSNLLMDIEELSRNNPQLDANNMIGGMGPRNSETFQTDNNSQYVFNAQKSTANLPNVLSPDTSVSSNEPPAQFQIQDILIADDFLDNNGSQEEPTVNTHRVSDALNKPSTCSCMLNSVRVVQQLDDDDFRITSLSLSQVLQLQKWIISQCYKPLDCSSCKFLPTVHTILVMVCDRLAEMFECIHKRVKKANQNMSGLSGSSDQSSPPSSSEASSASERQEQLYCGTFRCSASKANCNPGLFAPEFQSMYSNEEQVHMIRVLLKLQIRNFRALLVRLGNVSQIAGSEARESKIKSMIKRLGRAASDIDEALQAGLQIFTAR